MKKILKIYWRPILFVLLLHSTITKSQDFQIELNGKTINQEELDVTLSKLNTQLTETIDYFFGNLNSEYITTGILIDQSFNEDEILIQSQTTERSLKSEDIWNFYNTLYHAQYKTDVFEAPKVIQSTAEKIYEAGAIPIGLININFNGLKEDAVKNGAIVIGDNKLIDNSSPSNSAYYEKTLIAASPLYHFSNSTTCSFIVSSKLFKTTGADIESIAIDFGDGIGKQSITYDEKILVKYKEGGIKKIQIIIEAGGQEYSFTSQFFVSPASLVMPDHIEILSDGSRAYIEYGCNNDNKLMKPYIFVEGLNFQSSEYPDTDYRFGSFGWDNFRSGRDFPGVEPPLKLQYIPEVIDRLKSDGFDIILIDFKDGAGDIKHNANILIQFINWANNELSNNNSDNNLVIAGASMGGVVSRYALSKMEQTDQNHNTRMFISIDSPQNGANIPIGDQGLISFFSVFDEIVDERPELKDAKEKLQKMAPKQLLHYHFEYGDWHYELMNDQYYTFPTKPYSISISNGSISANSQGFSAGDKLLDIDKKISKYGILVARIQGEPRAISDGSTFLWAKVYILTSGTTTIEYTCNGCKPYDSSPGAKRYTNKAIGDEIYPNHCFIPSVSSLDIANDPFWNISNSSLMDNYPYIRQENQDISPFDAFYMNPTGENENHVETTFENANFTVDRASSNDLKLQNRSLNNRTYEARNTITLGKDIFNSQSSPNVGMVTQTEDKAYLYAGEKISLKPGVKIQNGSNFKASIKGFCEENPIEYAPPQPLWDFITMVSIPTSFISKCLVYKVRDADVMHTIIQDKDGLIVCTGSGTVFPSILGPQFAKYCCPGSAPLIQGETYNIITSFANSTDVYTIRHTAIYSGGKFTGNKGENEITRDILPIKSIVNSNNNQITVYPNPSMGIFTVSVSSNTMEKAELKIFNSTGIQVYQKEIFNKNENVDISHLSKGMYQLMCNINGKLYYDKIVIY